MPTTDRLRNALIVGLLGLLTLAVYLPTLGYPLVYDDLHWLPLSATWAGWDARYLAPRLPWIVANAIGGGLPWAFHGLAVTVHLVNGLLLYAIARRWLSAMGAMTALALFWLAPIQVEAVAYVSGANESLVALYVLLSIFCGLRGGWWLAPAAGALILAAALKPSALPALFVVPMAIGSAWLLPIALVAGIVLIWPALLYTGALHGLSVAGVPVVAAALFRYLWPFGLSIEHDWLTVAPLFTFTACAALLYVGVLAWIGSDVWAAPWYAWLWIVGLTVPRGLVPNAPPLTEHHTYLPFLAIWLLIGSAVDRFVVPERTLCLISTI